ncbi:hypothetical protein N44_01734 [Microcystis aeruginosa NIES-44]|uniref:Uncharacterized protein n=1 Tax=Microcystis aeruginosa NIES-44 TaxID=449439 RepID=A0A0A1VTA5_MICAE|nr:hypothetical protein N44_01734 [Microcystis aeruginosa NIES-44]
MEKRLKHILVGAWDFWQAAATQQPFVPFLREKLILCNNY